MTDRTVTATDRLIIWGLLTTCLIIVPGILFLGRTAHVWSVESRSTIRSAQTRVTIREKTPADTTTHEALKSFRQPIAGWKAEQRVLEHRALRALRELEADYRPR